MAMIDVEAKVKSLESQLDAARSRESKAGAEAASKLEALERKLVETRNGAGRAQSQLETVQRERDKLEKEKQKIADEKGEVEARCNKQVEKLKLELATAKADAGACRSCPGCCQCGESYTPMACASANDTHIGIIRTLICILGTLFGIIRTVICIICALIGIMGTLIGIIRTVIGTAPFGPLRSCTGHSAHHRTDRSQPLSGQPHRLTPCAEPRAALQSNASRMSATRRSARSRVTSRLRPSSTS
jgi:hypothetical protein